MNWNFESICIFILLPVLFLATLIYALIPGGDTEKLHKRYRIRFKLRNGNFKADNIRRGVSIIGSAGSGKTESVVYTILQHFSQHDFAGVIHDYKDFELTEMAYPLFKEQNIPFYTIGFDQIHYRVNPIAPKYLPNEESVNETSRVLLENLLDHNMASATGTNKFFSDAVEGLFSGIIWKMKTAYPNYCTLPHIIALFQSVSTKKLVALLKTDLTARSMASAFIGGLDSEKQTAGIKSSLANALKKLSSRKLMYVLSKDEVPLDINTTEHKSIISLVNHPKYDTAYSPIIAMIMHTIIKQMSERGRNPSFLLMEEAPTLKLPNMHRIPATLRSYDISTVYVMQDKVQNDLLYGDKASKAILSNLSYQFFGKVNDPDTAKYYERFFELIKAPTKSVSKSSGLSMESRITQGEKEIAKRRASLFFTLKQGEFIAFADGKDKLVRFRHPKIEKQVPPSALSVEEKDLQFNLQQIYNDIRKMLS